MISSLTSTRRSPKLPRLPSKKAPAYAGVFLFPDAAVEGSGEIIRLNKIFRFREVGTVTLANVYSLDLERTDKGDRWNDP